VGQHLFGVQLLGSGMQLFDQFPNGDNHRLAAQILNSKERDDVGIHQSLCQLNEEIQSLQGDLRFLRLYVCLILAALKDLVSTEEVHLVAEQGHVIILVEVFHLEDIVHLTALFK